MKDNIIIKSIAWFITPIAAPAWLLEKTISRVIKREWRFNTYTAIPLFLIYSLLSIALLINSNFYAKTIGLYVITAMQLLSFFLSLVILIGTDSELLKVIRFYGKRDFVPIKTTFTVGSLVRGSFGLFFSIFFFSCLYFYSDSISTNQFLGINRNNIATTFFDFLYFSFATFTTSNSTINPNCILTKFISMVEVLLGLFYLVFLFGAFLSIHVGKVYDKTNR